tara:strand:- start:461 stop:700 length:240 start_codon:yes stop_codon:yes gene_type:complete
MPFVCVNERYGDGEYETAEDFMEMCQEVFGEAPTLIERVLGELSEFIAPSWCQNEKERMECQRAEYGHWEVVLRKNENE